MSTLEQTRFVILRELLRFQDPINSFLQHTGIFKGRESMVKLRLRVEPQLSKIIKETPKVGSNQDEFYDTERNIMLEAKFREMKAIVMGDCCFPPPRSGPPLKPKWTGANQIHIHLMHRRGPFDSENAILPFLSVGAFLLLDAWA
jgi:hypothetical protein